MATKPAAKAPAKKAAPAEKPAAKAPAPKAAAAKGAEKPARKPNAALMKPLKPSEQLAAVVGKDSLPRTEVVSKIWEYIRKHNLQNPENKREILADDKLKPIFGKDKVSMFEMNKFLSGHLS